MAGKKKNSGSGEGLSWAIIVVMFAIGAWPIGLILLFLKLWDGGSGRQKKLSQAEQEKIREASRKYTPVDRPVIDLEPAAEAKSTAETKPQKGGARRAAQAITKTPRTSGRGALLLKIGGGVVLAIGAMALYNAVDLMIWLGMDTYYLWQALQAGAVCLAGGAAIFAGVRMGRRLRRNQRYLDLLGKRKEVSFQQMGRMMGLPQEKVARDLRDMWNRGDLPEGALLDLQTGTYFASVQAAEKAWEEEKQPQQRDEGWSGLLRSIRQANDTIADPVLSARVDRITDVAGRILRLADEDPDKARQVQGFLDYYLPTTHRLLDSYASFEASGLESRELEAAQTRIATAMERLEEGYIHQLEALYRADTMDVETENPRNGDHAPAGSGRRGKGLSPLIKSIEKKAAAALEFSQCRRSIWRDRGRFSRGISG